VVNSVELLKSLVDSGSTPLGKPTLVIGSAALSQPHDVRRDSIMLAVRSCSGRFPIPWDIGLTLGFKKALGRPPTYAVRHGLVQLAWRGLKPLWPCRVRCSQPSAEVSGQTSRGAAENPAPRRSPSPVRSIPFRSADA
jgi:hypothetical protein